MEKISNDKIKILAVDDNPKNIQVIGSILRNSGYSVGFASNGQQALDLLSKTQDFDLVLLDINMPIMNGLETCKTMRDDKNMKEIPVIFLTALNDAENIVEGFDAGGQDYVTKPFNSKEVLSRIKTHIDLKRSKDQLKKVNQWLEVKVLERTLELQDANNKLEEANQELEVLDKSKSDFLSIISHQINTPLNGILGFTAILKEEIIDQRLKEMFHYLELSAKRLEKFAKVSLKITELRTKKLTVQKKEISLIKIMESTKSILSEQLNMKNIDITFVNNTDTNVLTGDQELIEFCFESILTNAIKYTPNGGVVRVKIDSNKEKTECSFIDNGEGFHPVTLKNLFQLFIPSQKYSDDNNGLDLALVKLIMDAHNGKIKADNNKELGATVVLTFPNLKLSQHKKSCTK